MCGCTEPVILQEGFSLADGGAPSHYLPWSSEAGRCSLHCTQRSSCSCLLPRLCSSRSWCLLVEYVHALGLASASSMAMAVGVGRKQ